MIEIVNFEKTALNVNCLNLDDIKNKVVIIVRGYDKKVGLLSSFKRDYPVFFFTDVDNYKNRWTIEYENPIDLITQFVIGLNFKAYIFNDFKELCQWYLEFKKDD